MAGSRAERRQARRLRRPRAAALACLLAAAWVAAWVAAGSTAAAPPADPVAGRTADPGAAGSATTPSPSVVVAERDIATIQPGPHGGAGTTTAYPFFAEATGLPLVFRKRVLHPGASIGEHRNDKDEIYYVLAGRGLLSLNGVERDVGPGDAILTRAGDRHGLRQSGPEALVIFVVFDHSARSPPAPRPPR